MAEVVFDTEDLAVFIAGEGGRVEDDGIEAAALFCEAAEPVEGVAFAEVLGGGVDVVEFEVAACPVEVGLREVEGGGFRAGGGGGDGEGTGVGEGVEEAEAGGHA